jgi:hypothetical protein
MTLSGFRDGDMSAHIERCDSAALERSSRVQPEQRRAISPRRNWSLAM